MIKYFTIENFRSVKTENILEFDTYINKDSPFIASPVIGFAGANASGKTSVLQAITFVLWFMQHSFFQIQVEEEIPFEPFITLQQSPTKFNLIFSQKLENTEKKIDFEYKLTLSQQEVLSEELYYYPINRKRMVYTRKGNENINFGSTIKPLDQEQLQDLRKNCSIVSFASHFNSQIIAIACKTYKFDSNITWQGFRDYKFNPRMMQNVIKDDHTKQRFKDLLNIADVGIKNFEFSVRDIDQEKEPEIQGLMQLVNTMLSRLPDEQLERKKELQNRLQITTSSKLMSLKFKHNIDGNLVDFSYQTESSGTLQFLAIIYKVLTALEKGSLLIIDEIEVKLHQNLVAYIIGLFQNKYENENQAQLIFSFHNSLFMTILKPEQLWFTEKNDEGYTEIFSAADFKDIKKLHEKNLEELYRLGKFCAKPRGI